jgi:hypothetical protein
VDENYSPARIVAIGIGWFGLLCGFPTPDQGACWLKERTGSFAKTVDELIFYAHSSGQRHILAFVLFREGWR